MHFVTLLAGTGGKPMNRRIQRKGQYVLFETTQRYRMIALDEQDFFVWRGSNRLELSDLGHEAATILHQGHYLLLGATESEPDDMTYLACQEGIAYRIYNLPQGLPTEGRQLVDISESQEVPTIDALTL
jgi:hypothetical protein